MAPIAQAEPDYNESDREEASELLQLMESLRDEQRKALLQNMAAAVAHHDRTGHVDPLIRFAKSVRASAALLNNPEYVKQNEAADRADGGQLEDVEDTIARYRAVRAG
jgi:hypothetical protein